LTGASGKTANHLIFDRSLIQNGKDSVHSREA
jgi:hypothetical protein